MGQFQKIMTTERILLLMLMGRFILFLISRSLAENKNDPNSHTTRVLGRSEKCFEYDVMEGQVIEVSYRVIKREQNTENTINFFFYGPRNVKNFILLDRKSGGVRSIVAGEYNICFENMSPDIKYVAFEVVMKEEILKSANDNNTNADNNRSISQECLYRHMISRQEGLGDLYHMFVHERSQIGVKNCYNIRCNQISLRFYDWFMETFANIIENCEDDQDLEVIYGKFVDLLKEFGGLIDSKDIIKIIGELDHSSKVLKEYLRVLEGSTDPKKEDRRYAIEDSVALHFSCYYFVTYYFRLAYLR